MRCWRRSSRPDLGGAARPWIVASTCQPPTMKAQRYAGQPNYAPPPTCRPHEGGFFARWVDRLPFGGIGRSVPAGRFCPPQPRRPTWAALFVRPSPALASRSRAKASLSDRSPSITACAGSFAYSLTANALVIFAAFVIPRSGPSTFPDLEVSPSVENFIAATMAMTPCVIWRRFAFADQIGASTCRSRSCDCQRRLLPRPGAVGSSGPRRQGPSRPWRRANRVISVGRPTWAPTFLSTTGTCRSVRDAGGRVSWRRGNVDYLKQSAAR